LHIPFTGTICILKASVSEGRRSPDQAQRLLHDHDHPGFDFYGKKVGTRDTDQIHLVAFAVSVKIQVAFFCIAETTPALKRWDDRGAWMIWV
jgi:hypothetical protein